MTTEHAEATSVEHPLAEDGEIRIGIPSGHVTVRGIDEPLVRVRARDGRSVAGLVDATGAPAAITIGTAGSGTGLVIAGIELALRGRRSDRSVDIEVEVPRRAAVHLRTASANVEGLDLAGPTAWETASGDVRVRLAADRATIQTISGDVEIEARTDLRLEARTVSGDLRVRAPRLHGSRVATTSGDIAIEADLSPGGSHELDTVSGDVRLATAAPVRIETRTLTGSVRSEVEHRREGRGGPGSPGTLVVGDGSVAVRWRSMSGDLRLAATGAPRHVSAPEPALTPAPAPAPAPAASTVAEAAARPNPGAIPRRMRTDEQDAARIAVLRALERGELSIDEANIRLEAVDEAGALSGAGWV